MRKVDRYPSLTFLSPPLSIAAVIFIFLDLRAMAPYERGRG
jgi:hypothetical protein